MAAAGEVQGKSKNVGVPTRLRSGDGEGDSIGSGYVACPSGAATRISGWAEPPPSGSNSRWRGEPMQGDREPSRPETRVQVFLSYATEDREIAESIYYALVDERRRQVFLDKRHLTPGSDWRNIIRIKIKKCDLFIFLITPSSVKKNRYTQTELLYAENKWPHPRDHVVPVLAGQKPTPLKAIPKYLREAHLLEPKGDLAAEVADAVSHLEGGLPRGRAYQVGHARGLVPYLEYLGGEASSVGGLCVFSLVLGVTSVALWHLFRPVSDVHLRAGAASAFAAALLFYLQRSHLGWLRGQIGLAQVRRDPGSFTLRDWLDHAEGWGTWVRYRAGWTGLTVSVASYALAFAEGFRGWPLWASLWVPLSIAFLWIALEWHVLTEFSDEDEPFKEWLRFLTRSERTATRGGDR
jgi:hypothetical protein